jgi:hypothetical protein
VNAPLVCYAWGSGGYMHATGVARTMTNEVAMLAQQTSGTPGTITGDAPTFLIYRLASDELGTVFDVGDGTHPRIDAVFIKLDEVDGDPVTRDFEDATTHALSSQTFNKQKQVRLTKLVVKGTPAASPTAPANQAGYARYGEVYIPAAWNAVIDPDNFRDSRQPIGFASVLGHAHLTIPGATTIPLDAATALLIAGAGGQTVYYPLTGPGYCYAKVLALRLLMQAAGAPTVKLVRRTPDPTGPGSVAETDLVDFSAACSAQNGNILLNPFTTAFATGYKGAHDVWGNGHPAGPTAFFDVANLDRSYLALKVTSAAAGDIFGQLRWDLAIPVG